MILWFHEKIESSLSMSRKKEQSNKGRKPRRGRRVLITIRTIFLCLLLFAALLIAANPFLVRYLNIDPLGQLMGDISLNDLLHLPKETIENVLPDTSETPRPSDRIAPVTSAPVVASNVAEKDEEARSFAAGYTFRETKQTRKIIDNLFPDKYAFASKYAVLVDLDYNEIVAQKDAKVRMAPASMTKILTILVAAEHVDMNRLDTDTYPIDADLAVYSYVNDFSSVGWVEGDQPTIRDLFYGCILPSGADAAVGLAEYVSGSQEEFVKLMNQKLAELGIDKTTHFTNCVGLFDDDHYSTCYDMAVIMKAAIENPFCRQVMAAHTYTTVPAAEAPEGFILSNWFLRRIEDKDTHGEVRCAKTGFVNQSGCCAASYQISNSGGHYLCVTGDAYSVWKCIYDQVALYARFTE